MARRKTRTKKDENIIFLQRTLENQNTAIKNGPRIKRFTAHDIKQTSPLTYGQEQMFEAYLSGNNIVANGSAGTGKSYCAIYLALNDILNRESKKSEIIIVRSAVASREIGHLPGEIEEKLSPYEEPYKDIMSTLLNRSNAYDTMKELGLLRFMATSFVRGLTWDNAIVVVDEAQSMTFHEINSVITRLGENSKLIICGDIAQNDLLMKKNDQSGYLKAISALGKIDTVDVITFTRNDIVRSNFVKQWICAVEDAA